MPRNELKRYHDAAERMLQAEVVIQCGLMRGLIRFFLGFLAASLLAIPCQAVLAADSGAIRRAVETYLQTQIQGLPGKASYDIGRIDAERLAGVCHDFDVSMANGARPWGKTQVLVRCRGATWSLWVPVHIRVVADYLIIARPINAGHKLTDSDVREQQGELSDLPNGVLTDKNQAIGRTAVASLAAGRPLRADMLRQPLVVQQGQSVKVIGVGNGFQVANEGRALTNAAVGQVAQVRLNSGQILSGVARADGVVEIRF